MPALADIRKVLPEPGSKYEKLLSRQNVYDIVREVVRQHELNKPEADAICEMFWTGDAKGTVHNVFRFCKKNMPYDFEPSKKQTVKTLAQIMHDAELGSIQQDCKHYALTCVGILEALRRKGYPVSAFYRFCSDLPNERYPKHVFCVAMVDGKEYWCDPVLSTVNQDYKYYYTLDKKPKDMALYRVSGLDGQGGAAYVSGFGYEGSEMGKHGQGWKKFKKGLKSIQPGQLFLKGSLALPRNSFLLLIKVNMFQMGRHLFEQAQNESGKNKLKEFWHKLGGKWGSLAKAINAGYHHYLFEHKKKFPPNMHNISGVSEGYVGVAPVAAAIATATPILLAAIKVLGEMGVHINPKDIEKAKTASVAVLGDEFNKSPDGTTPEGTQMEASTTDDGKQVLDIKKLHGGNDDHESMTAPDVKTVAEAEADADDDGGDTAGKSLVAVPKGEKVIDTSKEIPDAETPVAEAANVATDWGKGVGTFVTKNKGIVITGVVALTLIFVSKNVFPHTKHR